MASTKEEIKNNQGAKSEVTALNSNPYAKIDTITNSLSRHAEEYEKCLVGITSILKEAWNTVNSKDGKDKLHALSLAKDCYSIKLELLTNTTLIEDASKFVKEHKNNIKLNEIDTEIETTNKAVF